MTRAGSLGGSIALHTAAVAALVLFAPRASPPRLDFTQVRLVPPGTLRPPAPAALGAPRATAPAPPARRPSPAPLRNPAPEAIAPVAALPVEPVPAAAAGAPADAAGDGAGGIAGGVVGGDPLAAQPPAEQVRVEWLDRHFAGIRDSIQRRATYPSLARRMGWEGRVVVGFRVRGDGRVADLRVVSSSGHRPLDEGALEAVRLAAPFPPPPCEADLLVPVSFSII